VGGSAAALTLRDGLPATPTLQAILVLTAVYMLGLVLYRSLSR